MEETDYAERKRNNRILGGKGGVRPEGKKQKKEDAVQGSKKAGTAKPIRKQVGQKSRGNPKTKKETNDEDTKRKRLK